MSTVTGALHSRPRAAGGERKEERGTVVAAGTEGGREERGEVGRLRLEELGERGRLGRHKGVRRLGRHGG